ncbi:MAG: WecB/TagA/CpsF family glycosyltransferase [Pirellulales bacterium]
MQVPRIELMGVRMDPLQMDQAVAQLLAWTRTPGSRCRFVVTPNVDHVVLLQERKDLQAAYADAALILADGAPVVWASKLLGKPLPGRVPGSDLVPALFDEVPCLRTAQGLPAWRLPGVADQQVQQIQNAGPLFKLLELTVPLWALKRTK